MNKKLFLISLCIAMHLETHSMLRKTMTAFMTNSKRLTEAIDFLKKSGFKLKQHQVKQNDELEYAILEKETKEYPDFTKIIISAESDSCFNVSLEQRIFKKTGKDSELYATSYANSQKWHQVEESWNRSNHLLDVLEKITKNK